MRALLIALALLAAPAAAQQTNVTFRYVPSGVVEAAFVPGSFNSWGQPYASGNCIGDTHESAMEFVRFQNYWRKTMTLNVGERYEYKIQVHRNIAGTSCDWLTDPLNPEVNTGDNNNSVLVVSDPMVFQTAEELSADGTVQYFSASLVSTAAITDISFVVNGVTRTDGLDFFDAAAGVFRFQLDREVRSGAQFRIDATDGQGRQLSAEIGELQPPVEWTVPAFRTVTETARLTGVITRLDGSIDPAVTGATVLREGGGEAFAPVTNGDVDVTATLELGANTFRLEAEVDGQTFTSDPITITRRLHPQEAYAVTGTVRGSAFGIIFDLQGTALLPADYTVNWSLDETLSTTDVAGFSGSGLSATGTATGPGEVYANVEVVADGDVIDRLRLAAVVQLDGGVRALDYAETASWIDGAVVYEIFPLQFGPTATGSTANPGNRLNEITAELDYIAEMGFNTIWFMPIMRNRNGMTPIGAGYNIIDFYTVDERLGTNEDLRALVDRAHELGIRVVLDITQSHVSPDHPWVNSLRNDGPYSSYIQTTPNSHNSGQDGRGANLAEIWQVENGENLYRKYDGFGDLANLNWDDDDLQAEMLDVFAYWLDEYNIDGFRMDVWWGPVRRYGAERFARPTRDVIRRQRPDAWILGEIAGTGGGTEVYYADDDRGTALVGGLDAAYDWNFYHNAIRGATFGNISVYDSAIRNGGFWPGPNARYFRFLENHDEERVAKRVTTGQQKALAGMLLTTTGIPMVYAGEEVGYGGGSGDTRRTVVNWNTTDNGDLARHYQELAQARSQFEAFWSQRYDVIFSGRRLAGEPIVYSYVRPLQDANAVVAINFEDTPSTVTLDPSAAVEMSTDGPWPYYDIFADTSASYLGEFTVTIPPYETVVYITQDNPGFQISARPPDLPFGAIYTSAEAAEVPSRLEVSPPWPNPATRQATLGIQLPEAGEVRVSLFDVLGRQVGQVPARTLQAGSHHLQIDTSALPAGMYLYRLEAPRGQKTGTLIVVR
ncbi:MAG: T9SS type A sorting domain-containing protein [Rhodothermales bacterium]|nr:T9SS type A sorting domain-containing protein [Rhodothermales bacterium]MBO6778466.1 T9SS type A sorting domain-containing protein [Rhodothermales bacterium]